MTTGHKGVAPASSLIYDLMDLRAKSDVVHGFALGPLLVLMIETPHPVHTHCRSSLYIYKVFEHIQQWLRVIRV